MSPLPHDPAPKLVVIEDYLIVKETASAYLIRPESSAPHTDETWIPKSVITFQENTEEGDVTDIELSHEFALKKGLVSE